MATDTTTPAPHPRLRVQAITCAHCGAELRRSFNFVVAFDRPVRINALVCPRVPDGDGRVWPSECEKAVRQWSDEQTVAYARQQRSK